MRMAGVLPGQAEFYDLPGLSDASLQDSPCRTTSG